MRYNLREPVGSGRVTHCALQALRRMTARRLFCKASGSRRTCVPKTAPIRASHTVPNSATWTDNMLTRQHRMESVGHAALQTAEVRAKGRANVIHHDQNKAPRRVATVIMCVRCHNMCRAHVCGLSSSGSTAAARLGRYGTAFMQHWNHRSRHQTWDARTAEG